MSAGGDDVNKAGFTARALGITEAARFSAGSETSVEADPLRQLKARLRAEKLHRRRIYIEGTTTVEQELPWRLREQSTKSRILSPCPHCEAWILPDRECLVGWDTAQSEIEAQETAMWTCPECGEAISETDRRASLCEAKLVHDGQTIDDKGNIIGDAPKTSRLWFHTTAWHNCFLDAADIATDEWQAAQIPEESNERAAADKELCQFVWSRPYTPPRFDADLELDRHKIKDRMAQGPKGLVPSWTEELTLGIDLGSKEGWFVLLATGAGGALRHVVDYGPFDVPGDVMKVEDALVVALNDMKKRWEAGWILEERAKDGPPTRAPDEVWIDAGNWGDTVVQWVASLKSRHVVAAYGRGESQMERTRFDLPKKTGREVVEIDRAGRYFTSRVPLKKCFAVTWDSDRGKFEVQQALTLDMKAAGAITLHQGMRKEHERFGRHICNEKLVTEEHAVRGERRFWKRTGANHLLDGLAEAHTAYYRAADRRAKAAKSSSWD